MQKKKDFLPDIKSQELKIDKRAIPAVIGFVVLVVIGLYLYFYWKSKREEKLVGEISDKVTVTSTIFPIYDIARNIVRDNDGIEIVQLIPSEVDPTTFNSTLDTQEKLADSDIIFKIGAGFDDEVVSSSNATIIDLSQEIELKMYEMDEEQSREYYKEVCEDSGGSWLSNYDECEGISQEVCEINGGGYNSCASACRHVEGNLGCIEVCVEVCGFEKQIQTDEKLFDEASVCSENGGEWLEDYNECEGLEQQVCEDNGGEYFLCESACRHDPGYDPGVDPCVEVCVETCKFSLSASLGQGYGEYDPYYWLSIGNAQKISETVYKEIASIRPELNEELYQNYTAYIQSLDEVKTYIEGEIAPLEEKRIITFTDAFNYFADEYDLNIVATFDVSELDDPSDEFKGEFERTLEEYDISTIYTISSVSEEDIQNLLPNIDLVIRTLDPYGGEEPVLTYIDMMRFNAESISGELVK